MIMTETAPPLTAADRCDRCGGAAKVRITTERLGTWLWCGKHARDHLTEIPGVLDVYDERDTRQPTGADR